MWLRLRDRPVRLARLRSAALVVGDVRHVAHELELRPARRLNDVVCTLAGEVRPRTGGDGYEVVLDVAELGVGAARVAATASIRRGNRLVTEEPDSLSCGGWTKPEFCATPIWQPSQPRLVSPLKSRRDQGFGCAARYATKLLAGSLSSSRR